MKLLQEKRALFLALFASVLFAGCASEIYPPLPPNSKFERRINTIYGKTETVITTGDASRESVESPRLSPGERPAR